MRAREHGKWHGFYENECQADIKQSSWVAQTLMGYFRVLGDGLIFISGRGIFGYRRK